MTVCFIALMCPTPGAGPAHPNAETDVSRGRRASPSPARHLHVKRLTLPFLALLGPPEKQDNADDNDIGTYVSSPSREETSGQSADQPHQDSEEKREPNADPASRKPDDVKDAEGRRLS